MIYEIWERVLLFLAPLGTNIEIFYYLRRVCKTFHNIIHHIIETRFKLTFLNLDHTVTEYDVSFQDQNIIVLISQSQFKDINILKLIKYYVLRSFMKPTSSSSSWRSLIDDHIVYDIEYSSHKTSKNQLRIKKRVSVSSNEIFYLKNLFKNLFAEFESKSLLVVKSKSKTKSKLVIFRRAG